MSDKPTKPKKKTAPRKKPITTNTQIKAALHRLFLRSRERAAALKRDGNSCQHCHIKASKAKGRDVSVNVHHINGVQWAPLISAVREYILCSPDGMETLCLACHKAEHKIEG